jgi:hypothetical protein
VSVHFCSVFWGEGERIGGGYGRKVRSGGGIGKEETDL